MIGGNMKVDEDQLKAVEKKKSRAKSFNDSVVLSSFLKAIHEMIEIGSKMTKTEMARFTYSVSRWMLHRTKKKSKRKCPSGTIIEVDFGLPYKGEVPYRHSALVIKEYSTKVLVVPSTSNKTFWNNAYHPIENPNGEKDYYRVTKSDGFDHDCVLVLTEYKVISKNRIISTFGEINNELGESTYKNIRQILINDIFYEEISTYNNKISELENQILEDEQIITEKKKRIGILYSKINRIKSSK